MSAGDHVAAIRRRAVQPAPTYRHASGGDDFPAVVLLTRTDLTSDGAAVRKQRRAYIVVAEDLKSSPRQGDHLITEGKTFLVVNAPPPAFSIDNVNVSYRIEVEG